MAWAIILELTITSFVQVYVSKERMAKVLDEGDLTGLTKATVFGAATSGCRFWVVAIGEDMFNKGAQAVRATGARRSEEKFQKPVRSAPERELSGQSENGTGSRRQFLVRPTNRIGGIQARRSIPVSTAVSGMGVIPSSLRRLRLAFPR